MRGVTVTITGGLRSTFEQKVRLQRCIEIQRVIVDRAAEDCPDGHSARQTLDLLIACLASNAEDIANCEKVASRHKRVYRLKRDKGCKGKPDGSGGKV